MTKPIILLPIVFTMILPVGIIYLISRTSGWQTFARHYPLRGPFPKPTCWMGYGVFRGWIGYNGGIVIASDAAGLYLRGMPIALSFCHDPIFIPWREIDRIEPVGGLLSAGYRIKTLQAPEVQFVLGPRTFATVRDHARAAGVAGNY